MARSSSPFSSAAAMLERHCRNDSRSSRGAGFLHRRCQRTAQHRRRVVVESDDEDAIAVLRPERRGRIEQVAQLRQGGAQRSPHRRGARRRDHAAPALGGHQQRVAERLSQPRQLRRQGRLADAELLRRPRHVGLVEQHVERGEQLQPIGAAIQLDYASNKKLRFCL